MRGWLIANALLFGIVLVGSAAMWLAGALLWACGMVPDSHPYLCAAAAIVAVIASWGVVEGLHRCVRINL